MPWSENGDVWVGRHKSKGLIAVSKLHLDSCPHMINIYIADEDRVVDWSRDHLRESCRGVGVSRKSMEYVVQKYMAHPFRAEEGRHQVRLAKMGFEYKGITFSGKGSYHKSVCWSCRNRVAADNSLICMACHWVICSCGSCGCGFSSR